MVSVVTKVCVMIKDAVNIVKHNIFVSFIRTPMWDIYTQSPSFIGGWEGKDGSDICAFLTTIPSDHWQSSGSTECFALIERKFNSHLISVCSVFKIIAFVVLLGDLYRLCRFKLITILYSTVRYVTNR